uniref:DUF1995 domain-containing protein n=1 Tax=Fibrocapsa japonica TaxID=94617 RepID=A0A7S2V579_9STRA|mmetsp:Transcript_7782/g.11851  ORF Transcript_7782/g.11851 Transcript_7782/m.11851 type:complete len:338 (+) Transcript_7782:81-1094(+)
MMMVVILAKKEKALALVFIFLAQILFQASGFSFPSNALTIKGRNAAIQSVRMAAVPANVKDTVTELRKSVQEALRDRCSRMHVDLPPGAVFGIENEKELSVVEQVGAGAKNDRELARLLVEMFQPLGENLVCAFSTDKQAKQAKKAWENSFYQGKIQALVPKKDDDLMFSRRKFKKGRKSFAAALDEEFNGDNSFASSILPKGTEVLIVVAPTPKDLNTVEKLAKEVGMGTLILLANARLYETGFKDEEQKDFFLNTFNPVYQIEIIPEPDIEKNGGLMMYRGFPKKWVIAKRGNFGVKILAESEDKFGASEVQKAVEKSSDIEKQGLLGKIKEGFI